MASSAPAERAYQRALELGVLITRQQLAGILRAAFDWPSTQTLAGTEAELVRLSTLEEALRDRLEAWRDIAAHTLQPVLLNGCIADAAAILDAAGPGRAVDHLAEALRHLDAYQAQLGAEPGGAKDFEMPVTPPWQVPRA